MKNKIREHKGGQSLVEYAVLIFLVAAVSCGSIQLVGQKVNTNLTSYASNLNGTPMTSVPAIPVTNHPISITPVTHALPSPITTQLPSMTGTGNSPVVPAAPTQTTNPPLIATTPIIDTTVTQSLPGIVIAAPTIPAIPSKDLATTKPALAQANPDTQNTQNAWGTVADMCMGCSTLMTGNYGW